MQGFVTSSCRLLGGGKSRPGFRLDTLLEELLLCNIFSFVVSLTLC